MPEADNSVVQGDIKQENLHNFPEESKNTGAAEAWHSKSRPGDDDDDDDVYQEQDDEGDDDDDDEEEADQEEDEESSVVSEEADEVYHHDGGGYGGGKGKKQPPRRSAAIRARPIDVGNIPIFQAGVTSSGMKRNPRSLAFHEYYNNIPIMMQTGAPIMMMPSAAAQPAQSIPCNMVKTMTSTMETKGDNSLSSPLVASTNVPPSIPSEGEGPLSTQAVAENGRNISARPLITRPQEMAAPAMAYSHQPYTMMAPMYVTMPGPGGQPMMTVPYYHRAAYISPEQQATNSKAVSPELGDKSTTSQSAPSMPRISMTPDTQPVAKSPPSMLPASTPPAHVNAIQNAAAAPLGYRPVVMMMMPPEQGATASYPVRGMPLYASHAIPMPAMRPTTFAPLTPASMQQRQLPLYRQPSFKPPVIQSSDKKKTEQQRTASINIKIPRSAIYEDEGGPRSRPRRDVKRIDYSTFDNVDENEFSDDDGGGDGDDHREERVQREERLASPREAPRKKKATEESGKEEQKRSEKKAKLFENGAREEVDEEDMDDDDEEEEEEEEEEGDKPFVEKILTCQKMSLEEALEINCKNMASLENCSMVHLDEIRLVKGREDYFSKGGESLQRKEMLYLIKQAQRSYLHAEWVTKELLMKDIGGLGKLNRFHSKPLEKHHFDTQHIFNPQFVEIDRILFDHQEQGPKGRKSYFAKWCGQPLEACTWEFENDILHLASATIKIQEYFKKKIPTPAKLAARAIAVTSDMNANSASDNNNSVAAARLPPRPVYEEIQQSPQYKHSNTLRKYQLEGVNWLLFCYSHRQSCIIADEMGLGKTIQTIAFLEYLAHHFAIQGPFLIIAPLSTLTHWQREFAAWTDLNVVVYHGSVSTREILFDYDFFYRDDRGYVISGMYKFDVIITTYEMALAGTGHLKEIAWKVGVFDEAHRLKNKASKAAEILRGFHIEHKILLTGTPLQNSVEELWSLLNFIQPYRFSDEEQFLREYGNLKKSEDVIKLQALLKPLMLRRLKEDVEKSIPIKEETIIEVEMTPVQKHYYRAILERNFNHLLKGAKGTNVPQLLNIMMELRKCCIHPYLIKGAEDQVLSDARLSAEDASHEQQVELLVQSSGKLVLVEKLLRKLKEGHHKVLIFSQMTKCLDLISELLNSRGWKYERIDGSVRGDLRQASIDRFCDPNTEDSFIFLLCTRAGGVGINLTTADTVIIFDSDWNPQNDIQAQARCHRIGQTKSVKVYRLITRNSYEREMFDRAGMKLGLDRAVLQRMSGTPPSSSTSTASPPATAEGSEGGGGQAAPFHHHGSDTGSKLPIGLSKKEVETLLKKGAYGVVMDNDEDAMKFCEEDIDQILERRTTVVRHNDAAASGGQPQSSIFSKASFNISNSDFDVDINDPNFWQLWAKRSHQGGDALLQNAHTVLSDIEEKKLKREVRRLNKLDANELLMPKNDEDSSETGQIVDKLDANDHDVNSNDAKPWSCAEIEKLTRNTLRFGIARTYRYQAFFDSRHRNDVIAASRCLLRHCIDRVTHIAEDTKLKEDAEKWIPLKLEQEPFTFDADVKEEEKRKKRLPFPTATMRQEQEYQSFVDQLDVDANTAKALLVRCQYLEYIRMTIDNIIGHPRDHETKTGSSHCLDDQSRAPSSSSSACEMELQSLKRHSHAGRDEGFYVPNIDLPGFPPAPWWDHEHHDGSLIIGTWIHGYGELDKIIRDGRLFFHSQPMESMPKPIIMAERLRKVTIALVKRRFAQLKLQELAYAHSSGVVALDNETSGRLRRAPTAPDYGARVRRPRRGGRSEDYMEEEDLDDGEKDLADDDDVVMMDKPTLEDEDEFFGADHDLDHEDEFGNVFKPRRGRGRGRGRGGGSRRSDASQSGESFKFSRWSKHDKSDFVRLLMNYGLPPLVEDDHKGTDPLLLQSSLYDRHVRHNWKQFRNLIPRLDRKSDEELEQVLKMLVQQCQKWAKTRTEEAYPSFETDNDPTSVQNNDQNLSPRPRRQSARSKLPPSSFPTDEQDGKEMETLAASFILPERARRLMSRLHIMDMLKYQVLIIPKEELKQRLAPARRSGGLPKWWEAGSAHDVDFLKGVALYGMNDPTSILNDPELCFIHTESMLRNAENGKGPFSPSSPPGSKRKKNKNTARDRSDDHRINKQSIDATELLGAGTIGWMRDQVAQRRLEYLVELAISSTSQGEEIAQDAVSPPSLAFTKRKEKQSTLLDFSKSSATAESDGLSSSDQQKQSSSTSSDVPSPLLSLADRGDRHPSAKRHVTLSLTTRPLDEAES